MLQELVLWLETPIFLFNSDSYTFITPTLPASKEDWVGRSRGYLLSTYLKYFAV